MDSKISNSTSLGKDDLLKSLPKLDVKIENIDSETKSQTPPSLPSPNSLPNLNSQKENDTNSKKQIDNNSVLPIQNNNSIKQEDSTVKTSSKNDRSSPSPVSGNTGTSTTAAASSDSSSPTSSLLQRSSSTVNLTTNIISPKLAQTKSTTNSRITPSTSTNNIASLAMNNSSSSTNSVVPTPSRNANNNNNSKKPLKFYKLSSFNEENFLQILRIILASIYLFLIILTIPLAFEIGGVNCGLSYSITILILYFFLATLRVLKYHRIISSFIYYLQHLLLPSILFMFLTLFQKNNLNGGGTTTGNGLINDNTVSNFESDIMNTDTIFKKIWWNIIIKAWKIFLINSTPLFTILEGFCSLLSIQAIGQMSKWLIKHRSDTWSIINLIASACVLSACLFFVVKIYVAPIDLQNIGFMSASLLGSAFTCTGFITIFGIYTGKGSPLECSLMFAYIVKCSYDLFPELSERNVDSLFKFIMDEFKKMDYQANNLNKDFINSVSNLFSHHNSNNIVNNKLIDNTNKLLINNDNLNLTLNNFNYKNLFSYDFIKNLIKSIWFKFINRNPNLLIIEKKNIEKYSNKVSDIFFNIILKFITENFPRSFESLYDFLKLAANNLTVPIILTLAYRIGVFFAATKIIPILQPSSSFSKNKFHHNSSNNSSPLNSVPSSPILESPFRDGKGNSGNSSNGIGISSLRDKQYAESDSDEMMSNSPPSSSLSLIELGNSSKSVNGSGGISGGLFNSPTNNRSKRLKKKSLKKKSKNSTNSNNNNNNNGNNSNGNDTNNKKKKELDQSTSSRLIYLYSPCIIIAVYTNLMIQYNDELDTQNHFWNWLNYKFFNLTNINTINDSTYVQSWQFWNWVNIFTVLFLYFLELISNDPHDSSLTDHWKG
ncbi:hypothetical protein B5S32_g2948 [[Candida] boidinii]|nr:hypothetical protein B5S32_g2948 [[Candida] boidinii]